MKRDVHDAFDTTHSKQALNLRRGSKDEEELQSNLLEFTILKIHIMHVLCVTCIKTIENESKKHRMYFGKS